MSKKGTHGGFKAFRDTQCVTTVIKERKFDKSMASDT